MLLLVFLKLVWPSGSSGFRTSSLTLPAVFTVRKIIHYAQIYTRLLLPLRALYCTSDVADLWHVLASCLIKGLLLGKSFLLSIGLPPLHWFPCKIYCPRCRPAVTSILHFIQTHNRSRTKINLWRRLWADYMYGLLNDQKSKQNSLKWSSSFSSIYCFRLADCGVVLNTRLVNCLEIPLIIVISENNVPLL